MHSFKTGLLFLTALTFATPACFTIKAGDDDDSSGGSSGKGGKGGTGGTTSSGGSSGSSGSSGNSSGGTTNNGGSSGSSGSSGSGGTGGSSTTPTCKVSDLELSFTCDSGQLSAFADATCKPYYACSLASICSDSALNCSDCQAYIQAYVTKDDVCFTLDQKSTVEDACTSAYADAKANSNYPQCK